MRAALKGGRLRLCDDDDDDDDDEEEEEEEEEGARSCILASCQLHEATSRLTIMTMMMITMMMI